MRKEFIWIIYKVQHLQSASSIDDDSKILRYLAPNDMSGFCVGRTKFTYLLKEAIGPFFKNMMINDLNDNGFYSILFDETRSNNGKKELQIVVKFFSKKNGQIILTHLETKFLGSEN
jgi:glycine cleavage system aminomethyltransferase T